MYRCSPHAFRIIRSAVSSFFIFLFDPGNLSLGFHPFCIKDSSGRMPHIVGPIDGSSMLVMVFRVIHPFL